MGHQHTTECIGTASSTAISSYVIFGTQSIDFSRVGLRLASNEILKSLFRRSLAALLASSTNIELYLFDRNYVLRSQVINGASVSTEILHDVCVCFFRHHRRLFVSKMYRFSLLWRVFVYAASMCVHYVNTVDSHTDAHTA